MNYDEITTGTEFEHKVNGLKIEFVEDKGNRVHFTNELGLLGSMYKGYFEEKYKACKNADYIEGDNNEQN